MPSSSERGIQFFDGRFGPNREALVDIKLQRPPRREGELSLREVIAFMNTANAINAARTVEDIWQRFLTNPPTKATRADFGVELDTNAKHLMEGSLHLADFITRIRGCEGAKEKVKYGPEAEVPLLNGHYGLGSHIPFERRDVLGQMDGHDVVEIVIDPIEGTTNASYGREGAISIVAGMVNGEVARIPSEEEARYMDRIVAPPRVRRLGASGISLEASVDYNVKAVMRAYGLSDTSQVEVVVMDRPRNAELIEDLRRVGVKPKLIQSGDLLPALTALTSDRPLLSMGSGGKEEAMIAAVAAKATDGIFEGRYVDKDGNPALSMPQLRSLDSLLSGSRTNAFTSLASITGTPWEYLGLSPVIKVRRGVANPRYNVAVASIGGDMGFLQKSIIPL